MWNGSLMSQNEPKERSLMAAAVKQGVEALVIGDPGFGELERMLNRFCPFEAMGAVRTEVRHSNFLGYILDPLRPHGFGEKALRSVLREVAKSVDAIPGISALDLHLMDLDGAEVRREWRSIDLLIALPAEKAVFAFELKIGSSQHSNQLKRYREAVESQYRSSDGWRHVLVFLRPSAEEPEDDGWTSVGYEPVVEGFEKIAQEPGGDPLAADMLKAYAAMMRRSFLGDEKLEELATALWRKHKEALSFLAANQPDEISDFFGGLEGMADEIASAVSMPGLTFVPDQHANNFVRFGIKEWQVLPDGLSSSGWTASGSVILIELTRFTRKSDFGVKVGLVLGPSDSEMRQKWFDAMQPMVTTNRARKMTIDNRWKWVDSEKLLSASDLPDGLDPDKARTKLMGELKHYAETRLLGFGELIKNASNQ
jgi:PD-(D/E)XK nuclease superfamily